MCQEDATVVLGCAQAEPVTVSKSFHLDLNGQDVSNITVADSCTLTVYDSATDDFTVLDDQGHGTLSATGNVVAAAGYVTVDGASFHRITQCISSASIRPSLAGIYFRGIWQMDETLRSKVGTHGVAVSVVDMPTADFMTADNDTLWTEFDADELVSGQPITSAIISNILEEGNTKNDERGRTKIYAVTYLTLKDGRTVFCDEGVSYSLYDLMKLLDENAYAENQETLKDFYKNWSDPMAGWDFVNIGKDTAQ